jgi:CHAT domain-containing protein
VIRQEIGDRRGEGESLNNIGSIYHNQGQYPKALDYYQQALVILKEIGDRAGEGGSLNNIGLIYYDLGQYPKALNYYQQALVISEEIGNRAGEGGSLNNIGLIYYNLGQYPKALDYYQQALVIRQEIGDRRGEGESLNNIGGIYDSQGQYPKALDYYQQALVIRQEIGDRVGEGGTLNNIGSLYSSLGQYLQALDYYQQALAISKEIGNHAEEGKTLSNIGAIFLRTDQFSRATETLLDSIKILESLRSSLTDADKVQLLEIQPNNYRALQLSLVIQNRINEALVASERGRNRAFIEQLAERLGTQPTEELVTQNLPSLDRLKGIATNQKATLIEYSLVYDRELQNPDGQIYIWVVEPTGEIQFYQTDLSTLDTSLKDFVINARESIGVRGFLGVRPRDSSQSISQTQQLQQLYKLLIEPIAQHLPTNPDAPVIFIPQGALFSVPFAALQDSEGRSLIESHTILTSPSIQLLEKTQQQRSIVQQANLSDRLIVGNPTMPSVTLDGNPSVQLDALEGSQREAEAIARLFNTQPLVGNRATKKAVMQRMTNARVIHLATHGLLDNRNGLDSAIALAPDGTGEFNDGLLTAAEIVQMKLNAELVVLSACDTAQGRITGDGVIGLSRSLILAGTPSVLVSLWAVPDAPTAELMTEFYSQWQKTVNKAQALRQAMLAIKEKHPNPINWAGFTLIGESE